MSSAFEGLPKTPNLKLNKPGYDNVADIEALNENADILDEEIQGIKNTFVKSVNGKGPDAGGNVDLGIIPISQGGTGATTAANARTNLGLGNVATLNTVPIANGGTGANNASQACANIGALPTSGGTMTGSITMQAVGASNYKEIEFIDKNNNRIGLLRATLNENSNEKHYMSLNVVDINGVNRSGLSIGYDEVNNTVLGRIFNKEIERVNSSGTTWIRYESGLQIVHGQSSMSDSLSYQITFPVAFNNYPVVISISSNSDIVTSTYNITSTGCNIGTSKVLSGNSIRYIAIGKWK